MNTAHAIQVQNLTRTYRVGSREVHALQGVDATIQQGKFVVLRGRSGSGKTTLLNCISGLDRPTSGEVWINGNAVNNYRERQRVELRRKSIGFVFQSHALLPLYSARENVDLMLRLAGWPFQQRRQRVAEVLTQVGLQHWMDHRPFEMSGGQQQRVSIARALAPKPSILIADEPTGELDVATGTQILQLFHHITRELGTTLLVATHDPLVDDFADVIYYLQDGQVQNSE
jgi:ABC-type lipoprotein export system ATPase subunit